MTLEDVFAETITSNTTGMQPLVGQLSVLADDAKILTEKGELYLLKVNLGNMYKKTRSLLHLITTAESRINQLTQTETGNVLDLSVTPEKRR